MTVAQIIHNGYLVNAENFFTLDNRLASLSKPFDAKQLSWVSELPICTSEPLKILIYSFRQDEEEVQPPTKQSRQPAISEANISVEVIT